MFILLFTLALVLLMTLYEPTVGLFFVVVWYIFALIYVKVLDAEEEKKIEQQRNVDSIVLNTKVPFICNKHKKHTFLYYDNKVGDFIKIEE